MTKQASKEYRAPRLSVYGSVRNLTGGSGGTKGDGNGGEMTRAK